MDDDLLDAYEKKEYFSQSGARYCPRTGFVFIPSDGRDPEQILRSPEFVHEQFHHISSMLLGAGFFLSSLRYARSQTVRTAVLNYECKRPSDANGDPLEGRLCVPPIRLSTLGSTLDEKNDQVAPVVHRIGLLKIAERAFLHMSTIIDALAAADLHPTGVIAEACIAASQEYCSRFKLSAPWIESYGDHGETLAASLSDSYFLPYSNKHGRGIDTYDLMEAFSVCADISMTFHLASPEAATNRLETLRSSEYLIVLEAFFRRRALSVTALNIEKHSGTLLLLLEFALDSDFGPLTSWVSERLQWHDIYPPARFVKAMEVLERASLLEEDASPARLRQCWRLLRCSFRASQSWLRVTTRPSFFEIYSQFDPGAAKNLPGSRTLCAAEYFMEMYLDFHRFKNRNDTCATIALKEGRLRDCEYVRPQVVFSDNGNVVISKHLGTGKTFGAGYLVFSNFLAAEDYFFGKTPVQLFPFGRTAFSQGEWYDAQLRAFVWGLEHMKTESASLKVPHPPELLRS